jgi:hypothetical protein
MMQGSRGGDITFQPSLQLAMKMYQGRSWMEYNTHFCIWVSKNGQKFKRPLYTSQ